MQRLRYCLQSEETDRGLLWYVLDRQLNETVACCGPHRSEAELQLADWCECQCNLEDMLSERV